MGNRFQVFAFAIAFVLLLFMLFVDLSVPIAGQPYLQRFGNDIFEWFVSKGGESLFGAVTGSLFIVTFLLSMSIMGFKRSIALYAAPLITIDRLALLLTSNTNYLSAHALALFPYIYSGHLSGSSCQTGNICQFVISNWLVLGSAAGVIAILTASLIPRTLGIPLQMGMLFFSAYSIAHYSVPFFAPGSQGSMSEAFVGLSEIQIDACAALAVVSVMLRRLLF